MSVVQLKKSTPGVQTAFNCLEEEHYDVAHAALLLAQAVERFLEATKPTVLDRGRDQGPAGQVTVVSLERERLVKPLLAFRAAASRVVA